MTRPWEIWDEELVKLLLHEWDTPTSGSRHWKLLAKVASLIEPGVSVLDVGCGVGHLYTLLRKKKISKYLGLDNSQAMLYHAKQSFSMCPNKFQLGDIYDLSEWPKYHTVVCIDVLIHLPDHLIIPLKQLWSKATHCLIFTMSQRSHKCIKKRTQTDWGYIHKEGQYLIQHRLPLQEILQLIRGLDNIEDIESYTFDNMLMIFKIIKKKE